jgi:hypothetical protein
LLRSVASPCVAALGAGALGWLAPPSASASPAAAPTPLWSVGPIGWKSFQRLDLLPASDPA